MFKKLGFISLSILSLFSLISCNNEVSDVTKKDVTDIIEPTVTETKTDVPIDEKLKICDDLFISEMYAGKSINDCALELATLSEEYVSLKGYKLNLYGGRLLEVSYSLSDLQLKKDDLLVILNKESSLNEESYSNCIRLDDNYLYNRFYLEIVDEKDNIVDCLGYKGYNIEYFTKGSIVRLKEHFEASGVYSSLNYIKVKRGTTKYIGNLDCPLTVEEILTGPRLDEEEYGDNDFSKNDTPFGGYCSVTLSSLGDGDTTYFRFPKSSNVSSNKSVRYLQIDTPEISHGAGQKGEPWGQAAKKYNNDILKSAQGIAVQTNLGGSLRDAYGRTLGFVWYNKNETNLLKDYRLLNFELVREGLAKLSLYDEMGLMFYKDVLYYDYLDYANEYAKSLGVKIHGEKDPDYSY